jgi:hypothetical protein
MEALLALPMWLVGIIFCFGGAALGVALVLLLRPFVKRNHGEEHNSVFSDAFAAVATLFAIVAGLLVFAVVGAFDTASSASANEAAALRQMYHNVQVFPAAEKAKAEQAITAYTKSVIADEWPTMSHGEASEKTAASLNSMFKVIGTMTPQPSWSDQYTLVSGKMSDVVALRVARIDSSQPALSGLYLLLLFSSAGITMLILALDYAENRLMHCIAVGLTGFVLASVLFLMVEVNSPYNGEISVSPENFESTLQAFTEISK